jgi:Ca2+-transporting ATPase
VAFRKGGKGMQRQIWHILNGGEICDKLNVDPERGLSDKEVNRGLKNFGPNALAVKKGVKPFFLFLGSLRILWSWSSWWPP